MTIKLYGAAHSTCTRRVMVVLEEKKVSYQLIPIDLGKGEHATREFRATKQPFGKVPVLEDDGFLIYESRAICKYIARKWAGQGTKLMPDDNDAKAYGMFEQACAIEQSYFDGPASSIAFEKVFKPWKGLGDTDERLVAREARALDTALATYEKILSKQSYLAGDQITLADLFHLSLGKLIKELGFPELFCKYPHVTAWMDELSERKSWLKINPDLVPAEAPVCMLRR